MRKKQTDRAPGAGQLVASSSSGGGGAAAGGGSNALVVAARPAAAATPFSSTSQALRGQKLRLQTLATEVLHRASPQSL
jgi:hypothetical protein